MAYRVSILTLDPLEMDSRVLRQIRVAAKYHDVTVVGPGIVPNPPGSVKIKQLEIWRLSTLQRRIQVALMLGGRFVSDLWKKWYWRNPTHQQAFDSLVQSGCDLIHINSTLSLPIGIRAAHELGAVTLFDAHEYSPLQHSNRLKSRLLTLPFNDYLITKYAGRADAMITVAEGLANRYTKEYGLEAGVIMNAPFYKPVSFRPVDPNQIRMIHHGAAIRDRGLTKMIDTIALLDTRYTLDFMLVEIDKRYVSELKTYATKMAPGRISFRPPVPPSQIIEALTAYDIGFSLIAPTSFSYLHALPNKFFEAIMAGLAVAIGPSEEMMTLASQYQVGMIAPSFEPADVAATISAYSVAAINQMKHRALEAAKELNADHEMTKLMNLYAHLLGDI